MMLIFIVKVPVDRRWSEIAPDQVSKRKMNSIFLLRSWMIGDYLQWSMTIPITPDIKEINGSFRSGMIGNFWSYNNLDITQKVEAFVHYTY